MHKETPIGHKGYKIQTPVLLAKVKLSLLLIGQTKYFSENMKSCRFKFRLNGGKIKPNPI